VAEATETPVDERDGPMAMRFVPLSVGARLEVCPRWPALVVNTDAGSLEVRTRSVQHVDRASFLVVPARTAAQVSARGPLGRALVLEVSPALVRHVVETYAGEIETAALRRYLGEQQLLPRTTWVNELCHRYLFERAVCRKRDTEATRFLETEIVKEVYFLCRDRERKGVRKTCLEVDGPLVARALAEIEAHLFEADVVTRLPRACGTSESTLLRAFKRELGLAPLAFVRARRLDEASLLLKTRRFTVGEVAGKVGYASLASFSAAFRARFGQQPSTVSPGRSRTVPVVSSAPTPSPRGR